jgi:DUF971 family protein
MVESSRPIDITADRNQKTLTAKWADGHVSIYPFALLRNACPCAECRGGHENMRSEPEPDMFTIPLLDARATELRNIAGVGNYAINLEWEDGHHFGIYNWHYLRALCPCSICRPEESQLK